MTHSKVAGFQAPHAGRFYSTRNDARYPSEAIVHYPLHPFHGRGALPIRRRLGTGSTEQLDLEVGQQRQVVPAWMTDEQLCARMTIGFDPRCSMAALLELLSLIQSAGL